MICVCLYVYDCPLVEICVYVLCCISCLSFILPILYYRYTDSASFYLVRVDCWTPARQTQCNERQLCIWDRSYSASCQKLLKNIIYKKYVIKTLLSGRNCFKSDNEWRQVGSLSSCFAYKTALCRLMHLNVPRFSVHPFRAFRFLCICFSHKTVRLRGGTVKDVSIPK